MARLIVRHRGASCFGPLGALLLAMTVVLGSASATHASVVRKDDKVDQLAINADLIEVQRAIDEQRYVDAARLLDQAALAGIKDPRLMLLSGRLELDRGHYADALSDFQTAAGSPTTQAQAEEGAGLALYMLGRSEEATAVLRRAVARTPTAWRAWNALGCEYDRQHDWGDAEQAYQKAVEGSGGAAIVLNNRGFSRLLQHRYDDAVTDLVGALEKKPDLAEARTNLRLALALKGDYARATAAGGEDDKAALLNNAGFAAALRGDYGRAESLLDEAIKARSVYYDRASENLTMVRAIADKDKATADVAH